MISFRHHVVSIVAVFLALAIGIALGGGPLSDLGRASDDRDPPRSTAEAADAQRTASFGNEFASTSAATLYADGLRDHAVAVLAMPGADSALMTTLTSEIAAAGAGVTGTFDVQPALVDPEQKTLVDSLSSQLVETLDDARVDEDASTYVRMGQIVGLAVGHHAGQVHAARRDRGDGAPDPDRGRAARVAGGRAAGPAGARGAAAGRDRPARRGRDCAPCSRG